MKKTLTVATLAIAALTSSTAMAKGPKSRDAAVAAAAKNFAKMDANSDGSLTSAEMTAGMQAHATQEGKTMKPKMATKQFASADANSDGKVTLDEFKTAAGVRFDKAAAKKAADGGAAGGGDAGGDE